MKSLKSIISLILIGFSSSAWSAGVGIGTDIIRLIDKGQYLGEAANIFIQIPLQKSTAAVITLAEDDADNTMLEGAYKAYGAKYMHGIYYQVGGAFYDFADNNEIGIHGAIGYEKSPAKNFLFFGTVKATKILDIDGIDYTPMLGAMFVF